MCKASSNPADVVKLEVCTATHRVHVVFQAPGEVAYNSKVLATSIGDTKQQHTVIWMLLATDNF